MNEPAIFYSSEGLAEAKELAGEFAKDTEGKIPSWKMQAKMKVLQTIRKITKDFITMWMAKRSATTKYIIFLATI